MPGLQHFKKGISFVSQWTGHEHKEMQKIFLGILAGVVNSEVLQAVRGFLDFAYYAQYHSHTTETLSQMQKALNNFHDHKDAFLELGIRNHFNIPKIHSMMHYLESIWSLGCFDGLNTESPERMHIDFAKQAYRASNRQDYTIQMTKWLPCQEALDLHTSYLHWLAQLESKGQCGADDEDLDDYDVEKVEEVEEVEEIERDEGNPGVTKITDLIDSDVPRAYQVAKVPSVQDMSVTDLEHGHDAVDFITALDKFLRLHLPHAPRPNSFDHFDIYKPISVLRPSMPHVSNSK
jgi:hypothetical protein